jgi:hypothetical protein
MQSVSAFLLLYWVSVLKGGARKPRERGLFNCSFLRARDRLVARHSFGAQREA